MRFHRTQHKAIASTTGTTLLLARNGQGFMLSSVSIRVRPVAVALPSIPRIQSHDNVEEGPMDHQIPEDADLATIATKLDAAVSEACEAGDQMAVQLASLRRLNAAIKAELAELEALRRQRSKP